MPDGFLDWTQNTYALYTKSSEEYNSLMLVPEIILSHYSY